MTLPFASLQKSSFSNLTDISISAAVTQDVEADVQGKATLVCLSQKRYNSACQLRMPSPMSLVLVIPNVDKGL
jgi:hypothetical protein